MNIKKMQTEIRFATKLTNMRAVRKRAHFELKIYPRKLSNYVLLSRPKLPYIK